jgi:LuxR family maltose regulon positive regulatory protein
VRRTKLLRPRLPGDAVDRPRLLAALERGRDVPLLVLSGPAGFGKTTLLSQWLAAPPTPRPAAWLTLDERDDAPGFVAHLVAALRQLTPDVGRATLGLLRLPGPVRPADLGASLAEELLAPAPADGAVLVLDDLQEVADPGVYEVLDALLRHPPPGLRLVAATRVDPPLPLARWRARGQLVELRAVDLRFTVAEAGAFLGCALPVPPSPADVALLTERTEGWAAGLRLAAVALGSSPPAAVAAALSGRRQGLAADYLLDDVLACQPPAVQDFLLRTALPERLCAPLCDALLRAAPDGAPSAPPVPDPAQTLLAFVVRANLFLTPLDEPGPRAPAAPASSGGEDGRPAGALTWYRYHPLFRDLLLQQLRARRGPGAVLALHARAGAWFAARGMVEEGLQHLLAAGDTAGAVALVERHAGPALVAEAWPALERWLSLLPPAAGHRRPAAVLARAWVAQRRARWDVLPALLTEAQDLLDAPPPGGGPARAGAGGASPEAPDRVALTRELDALTAAVRFGAGDLAGARAAADRALAGPPAGHHARGLAVFYAALCDLAAEGVDAAARRLGAVTPATGAGPAAGAAYDVAGALLGVGWAQLLAGRTHEAERLGRALLARGGAGGVPAGRWWGHVLLGAVRYEWDHLQDAAGHFEAALAERDAAPLNAVREATFGLALALQAQGRPAAAAGALDRLSDALLTTANPRQFAAVDVLRAHLALRRGDPAAAGRWLRSGAGVPPQHLLHSLLVVAPLTRAWADLGLAAAAPAPGAARTAVVARIDALVAEAGQLHLTTRQAQALALRALALDAQGREDAALDALEGALALGEQGGLVRTFLDLGPPLAGLLRRLAAARRSPGDYPQRLFAAAAGVSPAAARDRRPLGAEDGGVLVEPLTGRELEVLARLARGLPNKEIAAELLISPETVKRHAANVYAKLGAPGRRQAVQRAAAIGLLPSG